MRNGVIRGAALDVYEPEPPPPGTILTPHFAFSSDKGMERMSMDWVTQLWDLLHGRDAPVVTPGSCGDHRSSQLCSELRASAIATCAPSWNAGRSR